MNDANITHLIICVLYRQFSGIYTRTTQNIEAQKSMKIYSCVLGLNLMMIYDIRLD